LKGSKKARKSYYCKIKRPGPKLGSVFRCPGGGEGNPQEKKKKRIQKTPSTVVKGLVRAKEGSKNYLSQKGLGEKKYITCRKKKSRTAKKKTIAKRGLLPSPTKNVPEGGTKKGGVETSGEQDKEGLVESKKKREALMGDS